MTRIEHPAPPRDPAEVAAEAERLEKVWESPKGWRYWSDVNNSEVGLWYTLTAFGFLLFGGVLALLMRTQLAVPENDFVSAEFYDQLFTLHGSRSEEHTSELQSLMRISYAVFCLKKKHLHIN